MKNGYINSEYSKQKKNAHANWYYANMVQNLVFGILTRELESQVLTVYRTSANKIHKRVYLIITTNATATGTYKHTHTHMQ